MKQTSREARLFKRARKQAGLTQTELAKALGYESAQFISNIERGVSSLPNHKVRTFCAKTKTSLTTYADIKVEQGRRMVREEIYNGSAR